MNLKDNIENLNIKLIEENEKLENLKLILMNNRNRKMTQKINC